MAFAYELPLDRIERRPQWMFDECFDVTVTTSSPASLAEQKRMLIAILEGRFGLMAHRVSHPSPVYFLTRGSNVKLSPAAELDFRPEPQSLGDIRSTLHAPTIGDLTYALSGYLQLPVLDKTGLTGFFDIAVGLPVRITDSGIVAAVRSALGLELERHEGTAESLIIDHVAKVSN